MAKGNPQPPDFSEELATSVARISSLKKKTKKGLNVGQTLENSQSDFREKNSHAGDPLWGSWDLLQ